MSAAAAAQFAQRWLPAWSGNDPQRLAEFYSDDALYIDPGIPAGAHGKAELLVYFGKLLAHNPNWVWTQLEAIPLQDGFLNKWLVQLDAAGKIRRNEVYFDRSELLAEIGRYRSQAGA
jgi:hypothetical protein